MNAELKAKSSSVHRSAFIVHRLSFILSILSIPVNYSFRIKQLLRNGLQVLLGLLSVTRGPLGGLARAFAGECAFELRRQPVNVAEVVEEHAARLARARRHDGQPAPDGLDARQPVAFESERADERVAPAENLEDVRVRDVLQDRYPVSTAEDFRAVLFVAREVAVEKREADVFSGLTPQSLDGLCHVQKSVVVYEGPRGTYFFRAPLVRGERLLRVGRQRRHGFARRDGEEALDEHDALTDAQLFAQPAPQLFADGDELCDAARSEPEESAAQGLETFVARGERAVVDYLHPLEAEQTF